MAARHMRRLLVAVAAVAVAGLRPSTARAPGRSASRASVAVADATNVDVASEPAIYLSSAERARTTAELGIATGAALAPSARARHAAAARCGPSPAVEAVAADAEDRVVLEALFGVNHAYADDVLSTAEFDLYRPRAAYFAGRGSPRRGARDDYGDARADAVAKEARDLCVALNDDKRSDDRAMAAAQLLDAAAAKVSVMAATASASTSA
ncbi:Pyridoxamine 5'-phosphate oxidase [Aureococcus anophagefferens]|nr:Pyridoxamine 5'-phosphate oxidase [Aureococcus anophagefferens]